MTLIDQDIAGLSISDAFVERSNKLGLRTIGDIMNAEFQVLRKKRDFSYMWYAELLNLLKEHELLDEFQQKLL